MPFAVTFQLFMLFSTLLTMRLYETIVEERDQLSIYLASVSSTIFAITKDLQQPPILDITLVNSDAGCPEEYKAAPIKQFKGTYAFCYCANTTQVFLNASCSEDQLAMGCENGQSIDPQKLYEWKDKAFCIKTSTQYYYQLFYCETGHKRCAQNLCLPKNQECPITNIFLKEGEAGYELQTSRESNNNTFLIGFDTSVGNFTCINDNFSPRRRYHGRFYPFKQLEQGCALLAENYSIVLDTQPELDFYKENSVVALVERLPLFTNYTAEEEVTLQALFRLKFNESHVSHPLCRRLVEKPLTVQVPESFSDKNSNQFAHFFQVLEITSQLLLLINGILLVVLLIIRILRGETKYFKIVLLISVLVQIVGMGLIMSSASFEVSFFEMLESQHSKTFVEPLSWGMVRCFESSAVNDFLERNLKNGLLSIQEVLQQLRFGLLINVLISILAGIMWYIYYFIHRFNPRRLVDVFNGLNRSLG